MCGIVGILSPTGVLPAQLERATTSLAHRGPDGQETWLAPDGRAGLGHRRLNIVSANGIQPIVSEDGRYALVANGEFYGFAALREALECKGHRFATDTDSEVALHLFEDFGPACLQHLRGEFAFIIWDSQAQTLFAARDRFGVKPLFWGKTGDGLVLGSEAKALFAAGLRPAWNVDTVHQQMLGCFLPGKSLFDGVRQVLPGHYLVATPDRVRLVRYWDLDYPRGERPMRGSEADRVAEVRALLQESVRLRTQAHVPVGYLVSGGLDSSALLGIGATGGAGPVQGFAIGFQGPRHDESAKAEEAAAHARANLHVLRVTDDAIADAFSDSAWHGETIQFNAHGTARFLLSREIQAFGYRAVMAGEGADELFAGYGFLRYIPTASATRKSLTARIAVLARLLGPLDHAQRQIAALSPLVARATRAAAIPEHQASRLASAVSMLTPVLAPAPTRRISRRDPYRALLQAIDWRQLVGRERARQVMYLWLRTVFVGYHMAADRLDMAHAVEVRLPYLDHRLFEAVRHIPTAMLAKDGTQKSLLRDVVKPYVPPSIYAGRKQPFYAPPAASTPGTRLHEFVQDTLRSGVLEELPFLDATAVRTLLDRTDWSARRQESLLDPMLMAMTSLCLLHRRLHLHA